VVEIRIDVEPDSDDPGPCITMSGGSVGRLLSRRTGPAEYDPGVATADRACAAVLRGQSILMVHQVRDGRDYWTLPGGGVEAGEAPADAAVRELGEETGLTGTVMSLLYRRDYRSRDGADVTEHCYLVDVHGPDQPVLGSDPELDQERAVLVGVSWAPVADLRDDRQVHRVLDALARSGVRLS
jgi:8-oxo-dGTP diphosphatase